jgi:hypothetical protein
MKKLTSLFFAVVSTMFLVAGVSRAAEKFESFLPGQVSSATTHDELMPTTPCQVSEQEAAK